MSEDKKHSIKRIYIQKQANLYLHSSQLKEFGLSWVNSAKEQYYYNKYELAENTFHELKWLCEKNNFEYLIKTEKFVDNQARISSLYELVSINEFTYIIKHRKSNHSVFIINIHQQMQTDQINIMHCEDGTFLNIKKKIPYTNNYLLEVFKLLQAEIDMAKEESTFDKENLSFVLATLLEEYDKDESLRGKINKFKHLTINKIEKSGSKILCNGIDGFYPETEFYLVNKKIKSSITNNYITFAQEQKIWKKLYFNRDFVGTIRKLSLKEMFYGSKIEISLSGFLTKLPISYISWNGGNMIVTVYNGKDKITLPTRFSKEALWKLVVRSR